MSPPSLLLLHTVQSFTHLSLRVNLIELIANGSKLVCHISLEKCSRTLISSFFLSATQMPSECLLINLIERKAFDMKPTYIRGVRGNGENKFESNGGSKYKRTMDERSAHVVRGNCPCSGVMSAEQWS